MSVNDLDPSARQAPSVRWWDILLAAVSTIVLILLALSAYVFIPGWSPPADGSVIRYEGLRSMRVIELQDAQLDTATSMVRAVGRDPAIVFEAPTAPFRVASVEMVIRPALTTTDIAFSVAFMPANASSGEYIAARSRVTVLEGLQPLAPGVAYSLDRQLWRIKWALPEAARHWRINMPAGADFRLDSVEVRPKQSLLKRLAAAQWLPLAGAGAVIALLLLSGQLLARPIVPAPRAIKTVLVLALMVPLVITAFLLPPFQGPDENAHWKLGLMFYRSTIAQEPAAYYLPEILDAKKIAFHQDVKFESARLRQDRAPTLDVQSMAASHQYLVAQYAYAHRISYPVSFVMAQLFPAIDGVPRALLLYYLCRLVPAILIVALLYALNRRYEVPYTAWFFFSLPLVMQQSVVITADTLLNAGTVLAVLLFLRLREHFRWSLMIGLCALCFWITASKFIAGGVMLLPLLVMPYRQLPRARWLVFGALIASIPVLSILAGAALTEIREMGAVLNRTSEVEQQLAFLRTTVGIKTFFLATARYAKGALSFSAWAGPLGWVDTRLSPQHLSLIAASGCLAFFLDVWAYAPQVLRLIRTRTREMAMLIGVALGGLCFTIVADAAIFYVITSQVHGGLIASMMMKHLFAAAILALLLPLAVLGPPAPDGDRARARAMVVAHTVAVVLLPTLFVARNIELAIDLFTRYWA